MAQKLSTPDDKKRLLHYGVQPEMQKRGFGLIAIAKIIYNQLLVTNPAVDRADCEADLTDAIEVSGPAPQSSPLRGCRLRSKGTLPPPWRVPCWMMIWTGRI